MLIISRREKLLWTWPPTFTRAAVLTPRVRSHIYRAFKPLPVENTCTDVLQSAPSSELHGAPTVTSVSTPTEQCLGPASAAMNAAQVGCLWSPDITWTFEFKMCRLSRILRFQLQELPHGHLNYRNQEKPLGSSKSITMETHVDWRQMWAQLLLLLWSGGWITRSLFSFHT